MTRTLRLSLFALLLVGTAACGRYLEAGAAVVDGQEISRAALQKRVDSVARSQSGQGASRDQLTRQVLVRMIQDLLVSREAARRGITISEADLAARLKGIRDQFPSQEQFEQTLAAQGLDMDTLRETIRNQAAIERIQRELESGVKVTDDEVRRAYGDGSRFEELRVSHILFRIQQGADPAAVEKKARDTLARIRGGADFAATAKQVSEDTGSKDQGGDLGQPIRRESQIVPEFLDAAFKLKAGQVSEPVRTQFGFHLIKVTSRTAPTFEQKREEIKTDLTQRRAREAFDKYLADLVRRSNVVVNPRFGDFDAETVSIVDHQFFVPASPEPVPGGIPGLGLPPQ